MTAEIVMMNKVAVAMAADSAVTFGQAGEKIFNTADKLFPLSHYHPIGIMTYGNAEFLGVPWETIIKLYRDKSTRSHYDTVEKHADRFMSFLASNRELFPQETQQACAGDMILDYFLDIMEAVDQKIHEHIKGFRQLEEGNIREIISSILKTYSMAWPNAHDLFSLPKRPTEADNKLLDSLIDDGLQEFRKEFPLSKAQQKHLRAGARMLFSKYHENIDQDNTSGIVIAGFGSKEILPAVKSFKVKGIFLDSLLYKNDLSHQITDKNQAAIFPFAQSEVVTAFIRGINPYLKEAGRHELSTAMQSLLEFLLRELTMSSQPGLKKRIANAVWKSIEEYWETLNGLEEEMNAQPMLNVVSALPKEDLATMAESLVNITSFKRRVTMEKETVGGPVDVAVISKCDGFVWIKKKQYFTQDLNPHMREILTLPGRL